MPDARPIHWRSLADELLATHADCQLSQRDEHRFSLISTQAEGRIQLELWVHSTGQRRVPAPGEDLSQLPAGEWLHVWGNVYNALGEWERQLPLCDRAELLTMLHDWRAPWAPTPAGLVLPPRSFQADATQPNGLGQPVVLRVPLTNTTGSAITVVFPAGLVAVNVTEQWQPGVLLCDAQTTVPANTTRTIALMMCCGDLERIVPDDKSPYVWAGVSRSSSLNELLTLLRGKAIDYGRYNAGMNAWWYIQHRLQLVLFGLTNSSSGLSADDRNWIASLASRY